MKKAEMQQRIERLEKLVAVLATGILLHEYSKDLCRFGTQDALEHIRNGELAEAIQAIEEST